MHELVGHLTSHLSAVAMLGLALWLIALNPRHRAYQAFATLLFVRALSNVDGNTWIHDREAAEAFVVVEGISEIALPFLAVAFGLVYPWRRGVRLAWLAWTTLLVGLAAAELSFLVNPSLLFQIRPKPEGGFEAFGFGPLWTLAYLQGVAYAALTVLFVRDCFRVPGGPLRRGILWNAAGWGLLPAFSLALLIGWSTTRTAPPEFHGVILWYLMFGSALPFLAAALLARGAFRHPTEFAAPARAFGAVFGVAYGAGLLVAVWNPTIIGSLSLREAGVGLSRLAIPILVSYALLRHQLFDIDLKVKWTVRQSTVAAAFVAVFFVVSEGVKGFFETSLGPFFGLGAAGLLIFAIQPLQRAAERLSDRVMPGVQDTAEWRTGKKLDLYRTAVTMALQDRLLTATEEQHLARPADQLGLSHEHALNVRRQIENDLGLARRSPAP